MKPVHYKAKLYFGNEAKRIRAHVEIELRGDIKPNYIGGLDRQKGLTLSIMGSMRSPDGDGGGQNYEELLEAFPYSPLMHEIVGVWRRWHLNDLKAGDAVQEAWLRHNGRGKDYETTCAKLEEAGLLTHDGYKYGSAWKTEELPPYIIRQVMGWEKHPEITA